MKTHFLRECSGKIRLKLGTTGRGITNKTTKWSENQSLAF